MQTERYSIAHQIKSFLLWHKREKFTKTSKNEHSFWYSYWAASADQSLICTHSIRQVQSCSVARHHAQNFPKSIEIKKSSTNQMNANNQIKRANSLFIARIRFFTSPMTVVQLNFNTLVAQLNELKNAWNFTRFLITMVSKKSSQFHNCLTTFFEGSYLHYKASSGLLGHKFLFCLKQCCFNIVSKRGKCRHWKMSFSSCTNYSS